MVKKNVPHEDTEALFRRFLDQRGHAEESTQRPVRMFDREFNEVLNRVSPPAVGQLLVIQPSSP